MSMCRYDCIYYDIDSWVYPCNECSRLESLEDHYKLAEGEPCPSQE